MSFNKHIQSWDHHLSQDIEHIYHCRCLQIVMLEKTLECPLDCKEIKPVHPEGNQLWISTGRIDAEDETSILWPPNAKSWLTGKDSDAGKDWRQEEKGVTEEGWHHQLNGHEFEQTLGDKLREACHAAVHGVTKSQIWLSSWTRSNNNHPRKISHAPPPTQAPRTMDLFLHLYLCRPQNATPMDSIAECHTHGLYSTQPFKSGSSHLVLYMT